MIKTFPSKEKQQTTFFNDIKASVLEDINDGLDVEIFQENISDFWIYDNEDVIDREYQITNPDIIDKAWLQNKMICTPDTNKLKYHFDIDKLCEYLDKYLDKRMIVTLQNIVFCTASEEDFDYLRNYNDNFYEELECSDLPYDKLGIMWFEACKVFVNLEEIIKTSEQMLDNGLIYYWELQDCINQGVIETLVHELRHLAQANPYIPDSILKQTKEDEEDAEKYARDFYEKYPIFIIEEKEQINKVVHFQCKDCDLER